MKYPTGYNDENIAEHAVIFPRHGWSHMYHEQMIYEYDRAMSPEHDEEIIVQELYFKYHPRVMWCHKKNFFCDDVGTWHPHWEEIAKNDDPSTRFTVLFVVDRDDEED